MINDAGKGENKSPRRKKSNIIPIPTISEMNESSETFSKQKFKNTSSNSVQQAPTKKGYSSTSKSK